MDAIRSIGSVTALFRAIDQLLKQWCENLDEYFRLSLGQCSESDHLPHHLDTSDEGKHQGGTLGCAIPLQGGGQRLLLVLFDLLASDFCGPLAGGGVEHDQKSIEGSGIRLRDIDEGRGNICTNRG